MLEELRVQLDKLGEVYAGDAGEVDGGWDGITRVYDPEGNERDADWLEEWFGGEVAIVRAEPEPGDKWVWRCVAIRTKDGEATQVVFTEGLDGDPLAGVPVARWWSTAPKLPGFPEDCIASRWYELGVYGFTDGDLGDVGFGMGSGDFPPGSSAVWVLDCVARGDLVGGLGWGIGANHRVAWPVMRIMAVEEEPEEPEEDGLVEAVLAVASEVALLRMVLERGWVVKALEG